MQYIVYCKRHNIKREQTVALEAIFIMINRLYVKHCTSKYPLMQLPAEIKQWPAVGGKQTTDDFSMKVDLKIIVSRGVLPTMRSVECNSCNFQSGMVLKPFFVCYISQRDKGSISTCLQIGEETRVDKFMSLLDACWAGAMLKHRISTIPESDVVY